MQFAGMWYWPVFIFILQLKPKLVKLSDKTAKISRLLWQSAKLNWMWHKQ